MTAPGRAPAPRTGPPVDPGTVKRQQRETWDGLSAGWEAALGTFERGAAAVTGRLLALGGVRRGQRVLDVATGLGEPALAAARAVGPEGGVLGTDISPRMLEIARRRAGGLGNVEFAAGDLESLAGDLDLAPGSFEVVLSRWGLMFAVDHAGLFRGLAALLAPGGVLAAAVWAPPRDAPIMSLGYSVLGERLELPPPPAGVPGPFGMSDPGRLAAELAGAGFTAVSVEELTVPFRFASTRAWVEFTKAVTPRTLIDRVRERTGSEDDPGTWRAVGEAAARFRSADGTLSMPSTALCLRALAPAR